MFAAIAVALGCMSLGGFGVASMARANGAPSLWADYIVACAFVVFAAACWFATPAVSGWFG